MDHLKSTKSCEDEELMAQLDADTEVEAEADSRAEAKAIQEDPDYVLPEGTFCQLNIRTRFIKFNAFLNLKSIDLNYILIIYLDHELMSYQYHQL